MKVREVIERVIEKTGLTPISHEKTCDHLMIGDGEMEVTKVASTFMATVDVIKEAIEAGANMIITHEPTWFTGKDDTGWVEEDEIYLEKRKLIEENHIAIWRFHDHMHMCSEDGIYRGFEKETGWGQYRIPYQGVDDPLCKFGGCYEIPPASLRELCEFFKEKMEMDVIQIIGDPEMAVRRIGVLVGGGSLGLGTEEMPMILMRQMNLDLVICGDITEWTLPAYIRDAMQLGFNKGMLVLGHERSEEPGMKYLGEWLEPALDGTKVVFIDAKEPFEYL